MATLLGNTWHYFIRGHEGLDNAVNKDSKLRIRTRFVLDQSLLWSRTQFPHLLMGQSRGSCLSPNTVVKDGWDGGLSAFVCNSVSYRSVLCAKFQEFFFREGCSASYQWFKDELIKLFFLFCFYFVCFPSGTDIQRYAEVQKGHDSATLGRINASRFHCFQQGHLIKPLVLMLSDPQFPD